MSRARRIDKCTTKLQTRGSMEPVIAHMENFVLNNHFFKVTIQLTLHFLTRKYLKTGPMKITYSAAMLILGSAPIS